MQPRTRSGPPPRGADPGRRRWLRALAAAGLALGLALPRTLPAQAGEVAGTVVDAASQRPIAGAQVSVQGQQRQTLTDAAGRFRLTGVQGAQVTLQAQRVGFARAVRTVAVGQTDVTLA
ncbi:MAG TPA: carboxypeptidase regulatory-like domain-containing protein, partial [Longimicrobiaceae bacterium]|nr:carboxypeptidase regulatory-like domain-containing protein [Longimicrobiaceae bacterium]